MLADVGRKYSPGWDRQLLINVDCQSRKGDGHQCHSTVDLGLQGDKPGKRSLIFILLLSAYKFIGDRCADLGQYGLI